MQRLKSGRLTGNFFAAASYLMWGVLPLYWALLNTVDPFLVLSYRVLFSAFFLSFLVFSSNMRSDLKRALANKKALLNILASSLLIFVNWGLYIWGLSQNYYIDVSFGYFMSPLVQVMLGALFLKEKMDAGTFAAFLLALGALLYMIISAGVFPWLSVSLAVSFSAYGLVKKKSVTGAAPGLFLETLFVSPICIGILIYFAGNGGIAFGRDVFTTLLIILSGIVTALPLMLFGMAAKKITLTALGFFQYLSPTCVFLIGVFLFHEPVEKYKLIGFALIWTSLLIYSVSSFLKRKRAVSPGCENL